MAVLARRAGRRDLEAILARWLELREIEAKADARLAPSKNASQIVSEHREVILADPRTAAPVGDRVLRLLASRPGVTAKDAAKALEVPLRTVQAELQQLVSDGACNAERQGRKVQYWVEDTTFSEPTTTSHA